MCEHIQHLVISILIGAVVALIILGVFYGANRSGTDPSLTIGIGDLWGTPALLGLFVAIITWVWLASPPIGNGENAIDTYFKLLTPVAAALFFVYQALAGAFFATTSVLLEANRSPGDPSMILVKITIERGDNWTAVILNDQYRIVEEDKYKVIDEPDPANWPDERKLHRRSDNRLLLGPKEKTQAGFKITDKYPEKGSIVVAKISSFAYWWPAPARSYATAYIPPAKKSNT